MYDCIYTGQVVDFNFNKEKADMSMCQAFSS